MIGPLFNQEMLLASRRTRDHVFRWIYAGWLVLQVTSLAVLVLMGAFARPWGEREMFTPLVCRRFAEVFVQQHMVLLLLATPVFVAGSLTDEKTRGTLQYLLTTDLTSGQIILGKLTGRILQVLSLALVGLPLLCFLGALGGVELTLLVGLALVTLFVVVGVAAATLLAAVWSRQTRDAVLGLFLAMGAGYLAVYLVGGPLRYLDPLYLMQPALDPTGSTRDLARRFFLGLFAWGALTLVCLALAVWRLRPAYTRQLEGEGRKRRIALLGAGRPTPTASPVRWKERHVEGIAPLPVLRLVPRWLGLSAVALGTTLIGLTVLWFHLPTGRTPTGVLTDLWDGSWAAVFSSFPGSEDGFVLLSFLAMLFFSLLVGLRCSGAVTGERERQTWEALLLTPLSTQDLIRGKLWGILGVSFIYLLAYLIPALALSLLGGPLCVFWVTLGVPVTVLAMYCVGAVGIWSSTRSRTSWRSLLSTLGFGYVGNFLLFVCTSPVIFIVTIMIALMLSLADHYLGTSFAPSTIGGLTQFYFAFLISAFLGLAVIFWLAARFFLSSAQKWVADRERTRHWHDEPVGMRRPRRRVLRARRA